MRRWSCSTSGGSRASGSSSASTAGRTSSRRSGRWPCAGRRRSASRPHMRWRWPPCARRLDRSRGCARTSSEPASALPAPARPRSISPGPLDRMRASPRRLAHSAPDAPASAGRRAHAHPPRRGRGAAAPSARSGRRSFVPAGAPVLTHCNAGALATGGYGTALGVVRSAHEAGEGPACSSARRARTSRARGSPRGSSRRTASPSRCSPTTWAAPLP